MSKGPLQILVAPLTLGMTALVSAQNAPLSVPMSSLKQCAEISTVTQRLACYDRLAERPATPATAAAGSATALASAPTATPKESFGLYSAEHPTVPVVSNAITGKVVSIGSSRNGKTTITLDGDQVWELVNSDPLLKSGDAVTISRAALGSFVMTTPSGRTLRLHRIR
jgi:hypothetical protein